MEHIYDAAVVGGGIAGFSAALSLKSLGLDFLWLGETEFGEKVKNCEYVRNYPAFTGDGAAFFETLSRQRVREAIPFTKGRIDGIFRMRETFTLSVSPALYTARTVILCTGVDLKGNIKGERELTGRGVSYCAVCDGALYRGKTVAAVLGSRSLLEDVEYLAGLAATVYLFTPLEVALAHKNVHILRDFPRSIEGEGRVNRIVTDRSSYEVDGVFLLREAIPPETLVGGLRTEGAHVPVDRRMATSLPGLFAAGDVTGPPYQFAKAAGEGLVAAHSVKEYLRTVR